MILMVVDGQGGGIGAAVIRRLREVFDHGLSIYALGTNSVATSRMMKAGANKGATGENAITQTAPRVDVIIGPLAVIMPNAMMGELTPAMAEAVGTSDASKILIPLTQENITVVGVQGEPLPHLVERVVGVLREMKSHV
ncbi:MAG: DUF3842 family protein [Deltaproteobacteria bacterium]|nr:DUF3842 family protein [Deltaproteobacteria bacterium]